ncbi:MAG: hypothetical protein JNL38_10825, partial [Myxococcales bacterium]|nr:hypothetical protein [Myxococcales bacterium]
MSSDVQLEVGYTYDAACLPTFECRLRSTQAVGYEPDGTVYIGTYSVAGVPLRSYHYHYEDPAHPSWPTRVTADVIGGVPNIGNARGAPEGANTAPSPPTQTVAGEIQLASFERDGFGNIVQTEGPPGLGICTQVAFDPAYAQFPTTIDRFVHGCGTDSLMENVIWDRGFGVPTTHIAADGGHTVTTLDAFGRPVTVERPAPDGAAGATVKTDSYAYKDTGPVMWTKHLVHPYAGFLELTGKEYALTNALGEDVAHMRTGDPVAGREWIVDRAVTLDALGAVTSSSWPGFTSVDPEVAASTLSLAYTTPGPTGTAERDGFHRVVKVRRNGQEVRRTTYGMFEVLSQDVAQLAVGPHQGKWTRTKLDGHGRAVQTEQAVGGDVITTSVELSPLGEPVRVHRTHTGADGPPAYTRELQYDTPGRVAQGYEPNTGFFLYVWDDAGRLVGTADQRGCGKNMFYDGLSRVTVEDFSPCEAGHAPYSGYDPIVNNLDAAEVRYVYDAYEAGQVQPEPGFADDALLAKGKLVAAYDRGAKTRYNYDVRGRTRRVSRQIAKPGAPAAVEADRYTAHAFVRRVLYDNVDRAIGQETGADVGALLAPDGTSVVALAYAMRGSLQAIGSSYGPLVSNQVFAADGKPESATLGDLAGTSATWEYDGYRRNTRYAVARLAPAQWIGSP